MDEKSVRIIAKKALGLITVEEANSEENEDKLGKFMVDARKIAKKLGLSKPYQSVNDEIAGEAFYVDMKSKE